MHEMQDNQILDRLRKIFYDNDVHPFAKIRWVIYLFMNGHSQDTYNLIPKPINPPPSEAPKNEDKKIKKSEEQRKNEERERIKIETEIFLDGEYKYNNIMMNEYLAYLEIAEPDYFEKLKDKCPCDQNIPTDKQTFVSYAKKISDYAIARDYTREGRSRRIYDQLKSDCFIWCTKKYREQFDNDNIDVNKLLTITLCHFIFKINILATQNLRIVNLLAFKETIRNNAGTPKASYIATADVNTSRPQANLPSLSLERNDSQSQIFKSDEQKIETTELTPEIQRQEITESMRCYFMKDLLSRTAFNSYRWQKDLPLIFLTDTKKFWDEREDIESIIAKIIYQIDVLRNDAGVKATVRANLINLRKFFISHIDFYTENRKEFTSIFQELLPGEFLTSLEIQITLTALTKIKSKIEGFLKNIDKYYTDHNEQKHKCEELKSFKKQIENHILFYSSDTNEFLSYKQSFNTEFMLLDGFVTHLVNLTKDKITANDLINDIVSHTANTVTPLELTRYLIKICAKHLTLEELKALLFNKCFVDISKDDFEEKFIKLCIDELSPEQLTGVLKIICSEKITSDALKDKLVHLRRSSVSDENIIIALKSFCCSELKIEAFQLDLKLKTHCATQMSLVYYQNKLLKLSEQILLQAEKDKQKAHAVTQPIGIARRNSTDSKSGSKIGNRSNPGSKIVVPPIPLPASPPCSPKGNIQGMSTATISDALQPPSKGQPSPKTPPSPTGKLISRNDSATFKSISEKDRATTPEASRASDGTSASSTTAKAEKGNIISRGLSAFSGLFKSERAASPSLEEDKKKKPIGVSNVRRESNADEPQKPIGSILP